MINKVLKDYVEQINNKDYNYKQIFVEMKGDEYMKNYKRKILNIAAILLVVILIGVTSNQIYAKIQWDIQFKEYQHRDYETGTGAIKDEDYSEDVEMDYITQDGISAKVDSLMVTDDHFEATINFKFEDDIKVDSQNFSFGYAVYDDEKNVYGVSPRMHIGNAEKHDNYTPYMYKEIGVEYNKNDIYTIQLNDSSQSGNVSAENRNIISEITMDSSKGFPKSKKIYIRIFDLGYSMVETSKENDKNKIQQAEDFSISNAEWIFEIDLPEKFYERQTTKLKLAQEIPGLTVNKIALTESALVLRGKLEGFADLVALKKDMNVDEWLEERSEIITIMDGDGNIYQDISMGTTQEKDGFKASFAVNKKILSKKLFLNISINGEKYTSELIEE